MRCFSILVFVFVNFQMFSHADMDRPNQIIRMGLNSSRTLRIPNINRVAIGNSKVLKAQTISNSMLLLIGKNRGNSTIRVWNEKGEENRYEVRVIASEAENVAVNQDREIVKVALEFLELDEAFGQVSGFRWPESIQFSGGANLISTAAMTGLNYEMALVTAQGWLHHLVREGWARVVANPELYVRLGEEAIFHSGGEFPVATSVENYGKAYRHIEWKGYGLTAKVLPQSIDKIHISSDINLEISELISSQNMDGIPALNRRSIKTKMNSLDGETVILSGLVKQNTKKEKEGLPFLSSIPLLGDLFFSKSSHGTEKTELLMAVTFSMSTRSREKQERNSFDEKSKHLN
jgi:Flp pilus assembly secretin CpaC